jgi:hypothetical protein
MYRKVFSVLAAAAGVGTFALVTPAQAASTEPPVDTADTVTVVTHEVSVAAGGFVRDVALCPLGKVVVGGGTQVVGAGSANFNTVIRESAPGTTGAPAQSVWLVAVSNNDIVSHTIGIFAVCADAPAGYQVVRTDFAVAAGGFLRNTSPCPVGKVVLAGGAQVVGAGSANFNTVIQESAPGTVGAPAQSVYLVALRNNSAVARTIGVFAVCANAPAGYQVVRTDFAVAAGGFLRNISFCPVGKVVLGGGAQVVGAGSANFNTVIQESAPGTTGAPAQSVHLVAVRNNGAFARTIGIFAVCADTPAGYQVIRKDVFIA